MGVAAQWQFAPGRPVELVQAVDVLPVRQRDDRGAGCVLAADLWACEVWAEV